MKKLLTGSIMFALVFGFVAGTILVSPQLAGADQCILTPEPFIDLGGPCKPEPGTKKAGKYDYVRMYECLGHSATYGTPCLCTYLGCVIDPLHHPPNEPIP
jgi:hypothetical protein